MALIIGGLTGLEREKSYQFAGFRTHILVAVGSCITSITSVILFIDYGGKTSLDPSRLTAQVLSGIGFLGTGAILKNSSGIRGLTTAAGIWATACIGIAIGYGQYTLGILAWVFVLITLYILKNIDKLLFRKKQNILTIEVDDINIISTLYNKLEKSQIKINNIDINNGDKGYIVNFFIVYDRRIMVEKIILELNDLKNIISIDYLH
ncbi:MgtC/SapB family protein [Paraclostridium sordellii]|uniref:MgtC/SapB family protein n=1 Tax=Paraclostridium sordellii TaxID=1505 RepID=UPI0021098DD6|nr:MULTISPECIES: MgtC/SapB family protein [Paeniclostridium]MCQ4697945.1 MgtC/SapB family protein [Paeniclostridium sordellii]MCR1850268.1 MgtC/SapB family protein [Paeniclostridium sordellii]MDU1454441.1 MgtC/SapB family protein [Paeniclostridium sordellii]MDU2688099.1 MgtC/SapB family protein [Paeniclostridium sordellii]MDU6114265.1 MgtC/SapB family protein [Paeniclostridium sordellii]